MGVSIDVHVYPVDSLVKAVEKAVSDSDSIEGTLPPKELLDLIMPEFGVVEGDKFYVLWNEYYDDYNAGTEFLSFLKRYYRLEDFWTSDYGTFGSANADDVADRLELKLSSEWEYED